MKHYFEEMADLLGNIDMDKELNSDLEKSDLLDALGLMVLSKRLSVINRIKHEKWRSEENSEADQAGADSAVVKDSDDLDEKKDEVNTELHVVD